MMASSTVRFAGSTRVCPVRSVTITAEDLELKLDVSEAQAQKLWSTLKQADLVSFDTPAKAVKSLKRRGQAQK